MSANVVKLPRTRAGRELIRECHAIASIWAEPPPDCCDVSEVDWDDLAAEIAVLFENEKKAKS